MGIQVDTQAVGRAARKFAEVEDSVHQHRPGQHLPEAAAAIPGGASEPAAHALARSWTQEHEAWHKDATTHVNALHAAAETHDATDQAVARAHEALARQVSVPSSAQTGS